MIYFIRKLLCIHVYEYNEVIECRKCGRVK